MTLKTLLARAAALQLTQTQDEALEREIIGAALEVIKSEQLPAASRGLLRDLCHQQLARLPERHTVGKDEYAVMRQIDDAKHLLAELAAEALIDGQSPSNELRAELIGGRIRVLERLHEGCAGQRGWIEVPSTDWTEAASAICRVSSGTTVHERLRRLSELLSRSNLTGGMVSDLLEDGLNELARRGEIDRAPQPEELADQAFDHQTGGRELLPRAWRGCGAPTENGQLVAERRWNGGYTITAHASQITADFMMELLGSDLNEDEVKARAQEALDRHEHPPERWRGARTPIEAACAQWLRTRFDPQLTELFPPQGCEDIELTPEHASALLAWATCGEPETVIERASYVAVSQQHPEEVLSFALDCALDACVKRTKRAAQEPPEQPMRPSRAPSHPLSELLKGSHDGRHRISIQESGLGEEGLGPDHVALSQLLTQQLLGQHQRNDLLKHQRHVPRPWSAETAWSLIAQWADARSQSMRSQSVRSQDAPALEQAIGSVKRHAGRLIISRELERIRSEAEADALAGLITEVAGSCESAAEVKEIAGSLWIDAAHLLLELPSPCWKQPAQRRVWKSVILGEDASA